MAIADSNNATLYLKSEMKELKENVDSIFLLTNATFVCLMQCGFACLEAGSIRAKNVTNIMMKNILDVFISCIAFWICGYAAAYGEGNSFIGLTFWAGLAIPKTQFAHWFFQFVFAATAATLVSGAAAERCNFVAYLVYSALISGFIYPVAAHWVWSDEGWLKSLGYSDFAGSGPVHLLGGVCAGVAAFLLGPRIGRFGEEEMPGHSVPLIGIGGMILITGFIAFNGGSLGTMTTPGAGAEISWVCTNTMMAGTGGAFIGLTVSRLGLIKPKVWNFSITLNAAFTGMVSVCAAADTIEPWLSLVVGMLGGLTYFGMHFLVIRLQVDDPLDATAVHMGGGTCGILCGPIFKSNGVLFGPNKKNLMELVFNITGASAIFFWSLITSLIMFGVLKYFGLLRVTREEEIIGLDITKHNEPAYPTAGWKASKECYLPNSKEWCHVTRTSVLRGNFSNEAFQVDHM